MTEKLMAQGTQLLLDRPEPLFGRRSAARTNHRHAVSAARRLEVLLEVADDGLLERSLTDLAVATGCDVEAVRRGVGMLDPIDHLLTADVRRVSADEPFGIAWAPVTAVVNLLLDWDLPTLEIGHSELSEWLGVPPVVTRRALACLAETPGIEVRELDDERQTVYIALALDCCPLTAEVPAIAG